MIDAVMGRAIGSTRPTKGDADAKSAPSTLSKYIPSTLIDTVHHPVWGLSSRHIERASIIRWQGIREVAPLRLLLERNPRAAEQRDTPSTSTRGLVCLTKPA